MNIIQQIEAEHAAQLPGAKMPAFQPGDTVIVNVKVAEGERTRVQAYEGVCIARSGGGLNENFTVRKISYGEGVERVFPVYSPMIDSVKVGPYRGAGGSPRRQGGCGQGVRVQDARQGLKPAANPVSRGSKAGGDPAGFFVCAF